MTEKNKIIDDKQLSSEQTKELLKTLKARFEKNMNRHKSLEWVKVQARLETNTEKLWSLNEMENTGGEPDVIGFDEKTGEYFFMIVQRKALKVAEVLVMTVKDWSQGRNTDRKITLLTWQKSWALSF